MTELNDKPLHGRPSKYKPEYDKQAAKLCKKGFIDDEIADFFEVTRSTLYLWKNKHPSFSDALKESKRFSDDAVEMALYDRAIGYDYEEVKEEDGEQGGKKTTTTTKRIQDNTAAIFWLKNRRPDRWRDRVEVQQETTITNNIMPVPVADSIESWEAAATTQQDEILNK